MVAVTKELKVGPGEDFTSFTSAVIDAKVSSIIRSHFAHPSSHYIFCSHSKTSRRISTLLTQAMRQLY